MSTIIVGGGWSGLAAAVRLTQHGEPVHLLEAAKQLGGRARNVDWQHQTIDNGQHLMIGAYRHLLDLLQDLGADETALFQRRPLNLTIFDTVYPPLFLRAGKYLPWPLSLAWRMLRDNGLTVLLQISRLQLNISTLLKQADLTVAEWLQQNKQSPRLIQQLWEPLCLATLNTPINQASAHIFAAVLQATFKQRHASDLLIPKQPLGDLFPKLAADYIQNHQARISLQTRVKALQVENDKVIGVITDEGQQIKADNVIIATSSASAAALIAPFETIYATESYPIATVYLQYPADICLPEPVIGLSGTTGQWLFDRSQQHPGLVAVVISGPGTHESLSKQDLIAVVSREIHHFFPALPATVETAMVIREKRATFACTPGISQRRPVNQTKLNGLWLAGDFVANPYPATLEGAILNGEQTATQLMEQTCN